MKRSSKISRGLVRDGFSSKIKETLAKRVAYRCSNPDCRNQTLGPQETDFGTVSVGVAAHIKAAAPGGKRYDEHQTPEERASQENGIWLCGVCAKLIDSDEARFPISLLQAWRSLAEERAKQEIGKPPLTGGQQTTVHIHSGEEKRPQLDIVSGIANSGGADGHFLLFEVRNYGNDAAIDIVCSLDSESGVHELVPVPAKLGPSEKSPSINYRVDGSQLFQSKQANPRIIFKYRSKEGSVFETSRSILQEARADGRFNLKQGDGFSDITRHLKVEVEDISFSRHSKTADGIVDSFSVTIRILFRNLSQNAYQIKKVKVDLVPLEGYHSTMFGNGFTETNDLPGRGVLTKTVQFSVSLKGRGQGTAESKALFEESKSKAFSVLDSGQILLVLAASAVSVTGAEKIEEKFDLTEVIVSNLR